MFLLQRKPGLKGCIAAGVADAQGQVRVAFKQAVSCFPGDWLSIPDAYGFGGDGIAVAVSGCRLSI
jgi:hypothetical protein